MAVDSRVLREQLECDKEVVAISDYLDKFDAALMMRGRSSGQMRGDYQNQLIYYRLMLSTLFLEKPAKQQNHIDFLTRHADLFAKLNELVKSINAERYELVLATIRETIGSRCDYFNALSLALPIGRYSYSTDVAWFHRRNGSIIAKYLEQHPNNRVLALAEEAAIKEACDFTELKMSVVHRLMKAVDFPGSSASFFKSGDDIKCEAGNYFRHHLQEPLTALAKNWHIKDSSAYLTGLLGVQKEFQARVGALKTSDLETSIALSEGAVALVKKLNEQAVTPLFEELSKELAPLALEGLSL